MATTKTDAQTKAEQTADPFAGDLVTDKAQDDIVTQFLANHQAPEGYSVSRDAQGWIVKKL